jgi:flagellar hook-length control protein FliK
MQMANIARNPAPSEMNVALQADSLGNVQLRARVSGDQVGAAILVDRHDVHAALASDLPALHQALTERQFRVENVSLSQGPIHSGNSGNAGGDFGRQTQQRNSNGQNGSNSRWAGENSAASFDAVPGASIPDVNVIFDSNGRLSVRA